MKFWKNQGKRGLALILALLMCLNMLSLAAFADTEDGEEQPAVVEEVEKTEGAEKTKEPGETGEIEEPEEPEEPEEIEETGETEEPGADILSPGNTEEPEEQAEVGENKDVEEEEDAEEPEDVKESAEEPKDPAGTAYTLYNVEEIESTSEQTAVASIGDNEYSSVSNAVAAAEDGDIITLLEDVKETVQITDKNLTLDLNGKTLSESGNYTLILTSKANVTIVGGGEIVNTQAKYAVNVNGSTLIVESGKISSNGVCINVMSNGTVTVNGGEIYGSQNAILTASKAYATVNINGGLVHGGESQANGTVQVPTMGTLNITGGVVRYDGTGGGRAINLFMSSSTSGGTLNMTGGTVFGTIYAFGAKATVNISGGMVSGLVSQGLQSTFNITGGTFTNEVSVTLPEGYHCIQTKNGYEVGEHDYVCKDNSNGTHSHVCEICGAQEGPKDHVKGEAVKENEVEATYDQAGSYDLVVYCTECGAKVSRETVAIPQLLAVASIGDKKYGTLQEAITAAGTGDTIVLLVDTEETVNVVSGKSFTLDLKGNTLSSTSNAITMNGTANVTITGDGKIDAAGNGVVVKGGTLTVESGTISGYDGIATTGTTNVTININGGTATGTHHGINASSAYTTVVINDGEIFGTDTGVYVVGTSSRTPTLTVYGGTITGKSYGISLSYAKAIIEGGVISAAEAIGTTHGISVGNAKATLTVNGGTIIGPDSGYGIYVVGTANINGGKVSGGNASVFRAVSGTVAIYDGYFNGAISNAATGAAKFTISGGYFTEDVSAYLVDGKRCVETHEVDGYTHKVEDAIWTVTFTTPNVFMASIVGEKTRTVKDGEVIGELPEVKLGTGYSLAGWATEDGEEVTAETLVYSDLTVTVKLNVTMTFSDSRNLFSTFTVIGEYGGTITLSEDKLAEIVAAGKAQGWKFLGWATSSSTTVMYQPGDPIPVSTAKLYARWELVPTTPVFTSDRAIRIAFISDGAGIGPGLIYDDINSDLYTFGEVVENDKSNSAAPAADYPYQCTMTLNIPNILAFFSDRVTNHALLSDKYPEITLYCRASDGRWATWVDGVGTSSYTVNYTITLKELEPWTVTVNEAPSGAAKPGDTLTWKVTVTNNRLVDSSVYPEIRLWVYDVMTNAYVSLAEASVYDSEGNLLTPKYGTLAAIGSVPARGSVELTIKATLGEGQFETLTGYVDIMDWVSSAWTYTNLFEIGSVQLATYTVTIGGEEHTVKHGGTLAGILPTEEPAREGHTFSGWFNGDVRVTNETVVTGDMTIEPKWDINTYTVTFSPNGGTITGESSIQVQHGGQVTTLPTVRRTGYTFQGWFINGTRFTTATVITGDVTVEAQWTRNSSGGTTTPGTSGSGTTRPSTNPPEIEIEDPDVPLAGTPVSAIYEDVDADLWYIPGIQFVHDKGLLDAISDGNFAPNMNVTRGMVVSMLHRLEGAPEASGDCFTDVEAGAWYETAVYWALENGIAVGYGDDCFGPEDNITREQLSVILMHYAESKGYDVTVRNDLSAYEDAEQISEYAVETMSWANAADLIIGDSATTLNPQGTATRAEAATMLLKIYQNFMQTETETEAEEG